MANDVATQFQQDLKIALDKVDQSKQSKKEVLVDIFKMTVAKLFEIQIDKSRAADRLEFDQLVMVKRNVISLFRGAELSEDQMSEEQYDKLFDATVQEIMNEASHAHEGHDSATNDQQLLVNAREYHAMKGMPVQSRFSRTPAGLIIPK
jgi:hypothetical protein